MFWLMIGGFEVFGTTEFGARFASAVLAVGTALATYHLGRRLFRAEVGLWAGLIVASTIIFTVSARAATVDSALTFVTTMAMWLFVVGWKAMDPQSPNVAERWSRPCPGQARTPALQGAPTPFVPPAWSIWALVYAFVGLPLATLGLFLLLVNQPAAAAGPAPATWRGRMILWRRTTLRPFGPRNVRRCIWQMRPLTAVAVVAAVALPWYVLVGVRTDGAWLQEFFAKFNLRPFVQPFLGHRGPFFYHFVVIFIGFFPWSVFLGQTVVHAVRQMRTRHPWQRGYVLLACWVGAFFVFWSACSTKLPHYVLPAYPALALLTACFLDDWLAAGSPLQHKWLRGAMVTLMLVGVGMAVAVPFVAAIFLPGEGVIGLVGLIPLAGGAVCLTFLERGQGRRMLAAFALTSVLFVTGIFAFAAVRVDRHQHSPALADEIRKDCPAPPQIAAYRFLQASMVFYAGGTVPCCDDARHLRQFLDAAQQPYVFTTDQYEAEIKQQFPGEFRVLARRPRFLGRGEVLVLARAAGFTSTHTAGKMPPGEAR
jgi:4-amino-4-deoxy-L-arabinose transferase-like glycosyltransferase